MITLKNIDFYRILNINLLDTLKSEIDDLQNKVEFNNFQKWIVDSLYDFSYPKANINNKSILIIAIPHPMYSEVIFEYKLKQYSCISLVSSDFDHLKKIVKQNSIDNNFSYIEANNLPLKRIGAQSGLSEYGRNNITYIEGLGSCFSYIAFFTDLEPMINELLPLSLSKQCRNCSICENVCPTKAINKKSFIIDNEKCLSFLNESSDPFPDWLPLSAHHSLYDCIYCQIKCPMNAKYKMIKGDSIFFSENEIMKLINQNIIDDSDIDLVRKIKYLGLDQWPAGIAKNIKKIIEKTDNGN